MLLEEVVQGREVLNDELPQNPLICLDPQECGGEVGRRKEVFDQSTHHPQCVLLLQKEQQAGNDLDKEDIYEMKKQRPKTKS